jgi:methionyl-tRNA formyltransferase
MRLIFAGTPEFAARALEALIAAGHTIALVLTQPDRPAGRGMKLTPSPVKTVALHHGLPVYQPLTLREAELQAPLRAVSAEAMIVAAYGLILPQAVLDIPARGCINLHASLLPRWRGAAPIQRAILAGDAETGITLMQMDAGLDTGAMLSRHPLAIGAEETAGQLHDRLAALGAEAIVALLPRLAEVVGEPQETRLATYAAKIDKAQAHLDWQQPALALLRQVRAYNPVPGAWTLLDGQPFKVWQAETMACAVRAAPPGTVLRADGEGIEVACATGGLRLLEVQAAGGKRLSAAAFLAGRAVAAGSVLV